MTLSQRAMLLDKANIISAQQQRGLSLILLVFLISIVGMGLIINFLPFSNYATETSIDTLEALNQAKMAVIGSASSIDGLNGSNPGQFPCYENVLKIGTEFEGEAATCSSNLAIHIGRFAWRSLNTGDLRDGNTDKLWYALSPKFRAAPINSDNVAGLSVDGVANQAIAILFSPGQSLPEQSRPIPNNVSPPIVSNYLDGENSNGDSTFITKPFNASFNDRLVLIKPDDIYPLLEKRVLADIKTYLLTYKALWGAYPYPAPFSNPSTSNFIGSTSVNGGLLPIGDPIATWAGGTCSSVRVSDGAVQKGTVSVTGASLVCTINGQNYAGARTVTVNAKLNNVALGFYQEMNLNSISEFSISPSALKTGGVLSYSLNAIGGGSIQFTGNASNNSSPYKITFKQTPDLDLWSAKVGIKYILRNDWHKLIFYKVAPPYLPGGNATCGDCLTINKWTSASALPIAQTDVHALLMSAGSKLAVTDVLSAPTYSLANPAQTRPGSQMTDYFDSVNNASNGAIFDSKHLPASNFNDQILIVE